MQIAPISSHKYFSTLFNIIIAYFFITLVVIPKAYSTGIILAIFGFLLFIVYSCKNKNILLPQKLCIAFFISFGLYFLIYVLDVIIHQDSPRILDNPSRSLFFLFIFFLLQFFPLKFSLLLYVIPIGGIASAAMAYYQVSILHYERALHSSFQMAIQHGDMSISLGMFSAGLFFYCCQKRLIPLAILNLIGTICGMIGSFLSLSRGGWLLMPFILLTLIYINRNILSRKFILVFLVIITIALSSIIAKNHSITSRIEVIYTQIQNFYQDKYVNDGSVTPRLELWKSGIFAIKERPFLGWGYEGARINRQEQDKQGLVKIGSLALSHVHNQYINDFVERGILGFLSLLGIFLLPLWKFFKSYRENQNNIETKTLALLGIIHITSVMSYGLTQVFLGHNSGTMFYFFLTVLFYAMLLENKKQQKIYNKRQEINFY